MEFKRIAYNKHTSHKNGYTFEITEMSDGTYYVTQHKNGEVVNNSLWDTPRTELKSFERAKEYCKDM